MEKRGGRARTRPGAGGPDMATGTIAHLQVTVSIVSFSKVAGVACRMSQVLVREHKDPRPGCPEDHRNDEAHDICLGAERIAYEP